MEICQPLRRLQIQVYWILYSLPTVGEILVIFSQGSNATPVGTVIILSYRH